MPQRAIGVLRLSVKLRDGLTVLDRFRQQDCLKARLPRPERGAWTTAVTLNSSGGVAQGDQLDCAIEAGPGTRLTVTSQAAERYYRSPGGDFRSPGGDFRSPGGGPAAVRTTLRVAAGAGLEWLPQETILFDGCALDRRLDVDVAANGWFLGLETLVFGRTLMGETVRRAAIRDLIRIHRDGRLVLHDAIRFDGPVQAVLDRAAVAGGGRAVATLILAAPDAAALLHPLRAALAPFDAGASVMDGLLLARIVARDGAAARMAVLAALGALRGGRPLPRVWEGPVAPPQTVPGSIQEVTV